MSQLSLLPPPASSTAHISSCGRYRYTLTRTWAPGPRMLFVMVNPSTADASADDPTIRRCLAFAKREQCGSLDVVNLFAWRSPDPADLLAAEDPIGPRNDLAIVSAAGRANLIVAAWGTAHLATTEGRKRFAGREGEVLALLPERDVYLLGRTADGTPRHPLYLRADAPLELLRRGVVQHGLTTPLGATL